MITRVSVVTILVKDQDEALKFYTEKLGLEKKDDMAWGEGNRWVTVQTKEQPELQIFLMKADSFGVDLREQVGHGPAWAFGTENCRETYETLKERGVNFTSPPKDQPYGVEAVFEDLYGNRFSLVEETEPEKQG